MDNNKPPLPRTEESLQTVLAQLEKARQTGDEETAGQALLDLAFLVKWVRSDNSQSPFERSHDLAIEALEIFRRLGDCRGQISALLLACPFEPPDAAIAMLDEADSLASELGDDLQIAKTLHARATKVALSDREQSRILNERALALFRKVGHASGIAGCLFSMAIRVEDPAERRAVALEAASFYREAGNRNEAGKVLLVPIMRALGERADITTFEPDLMEALADAQAVGNRTLEERCYGHLSRIAGAKGKADEAEMYSRWQNDLRDADGLAPNERWLNDIDMTEALIAIAVKTGNTEAVRMFQEHLQTLKKDKP